MDPHVTFQNSQHWTSSSVSARSNTLIENSDIKPPILVTDCTIMSTHVAWRWDTSCGTAQSTCGGSFTPLGACGNTNGQGDLLWNRNNTTGSDLLCPDSLWPCDPLWLRPTLAARPTLARHCQRSDQFFADNKNGEKSKQKQQRKENEHGAKEQKHRNKQYTENQWKDKTIFLFHFCVSGPCLGTSPAGSQKLIIHKKNTQIKQLVFWERRREKRWERKWEREDERENMRERERENERKWQRKQKKEKERENDRENVRENVREKTEIRKLDKKKKDWKNGAKIKERKQNARKNTECKKEHRKNTHQRTQDERKNTGSKNTDSFFCGRDKRCCKEEIDVLTEQTTQSQSRLGRWHDPWLSINSDILTKPTDNRELVSFPETFSQLLVAHLQPSAQSFPWKLGCWHGKAPRHGEDAAASNDMVTGHLFDWMRNATSRSSSATANLAFNADLSQSETATAPLVAAHSKTLLPQPPNADLALTREPNSAARAASTRTPFSPPCEWTCGTAPLRHRPEPSWTFSNSFFNASTACQKQMCQLQRLLQLQISRVGWLSRMCRFTLVLGTLTFNPAAPRWHCCTLAMASVSHRANSEPVDGAYRKTLHRTWRNDRRLRHPSNASGTGFFGSAAGTTLARFDAASLDQLVHFSAELGDRGFELLDSVGACCPLPSEVGGDGCLFNSSNLADATLCSSCMRSCSWTAATTASVAFCRDALQRGPCTASTRPTACWDGHDPCELVPCRWCSPHTWPISPRLRLLSPKNRAAWLKLQASELKSACGRLTECAHNLCLSLRWLLWTCAWPSAPTAAEGPSTTVVTGGTNPRCALSCTASHHD